MAKQTKPNQPPEADKPDDVAVALEAGQNDTQPEQQQLPAAVLSGQQEEQGATDPHGENLQEPGEMPDPSATPEPPASESVVVECAVLYDNIYGKHDDIIELPADEAEAARAGGYVDTHPNAISAIRGMG